MVSAHACLRSLLQRGHEENLFTGGCFRLFRFDGETLAEGAVGDTGHGERRPVNADTIWDLASLTKPAATATCLLALAARGLLHLDEPVGLHLGDTGTHLDGVTLRHCLTHTSGLPAWTRLFEQAEPREAVVRRVAASARERAPGAGYVYSDLGYILLGEAAARAGGMPLDELVRELVLAPLGMSRSGYRPPETLLPEIAATWCAERRELLVGSVHDANCAALEGVAGHAGLFGSLNDLTRYGRALLNGGILDGARLLPPLAAAAMGRIQTPPGLPAHTLGWFAAGNAMLPAGDLLPADTFGHTGFTGTSLLLCPSLGLGILLLTNRVAVQRYAAAFLRFRRRFHNAAAAIL